MAEQGARSAHRTRRCAATPRRIRVAARPPRCTAGHCRPARRQRAHAVQRASREARTRQFKGKPPGRDARSRDRVMMNAPRAIVVFVPVPAAGSQEPLRARQAATLSAGESATTLPRFVPPAQQLDAIRHQSREMFIEQARAQRVAHG